MSKLILVVFSFLFVLVGCWDDDGVSASSEEKMLMKNVRTIAWFQSSENEETRGKVIAICKNNPGVYRDTPNCINAQSAQHNINMDIAREKALNHKPRKLDPVKW